VTALRLPGSTGVRLLPDHVRDLVAETIYVRDLRQHHIGREGVTENDIMVVIVPMGPHGDGVEIWDGVPV